MIPKLHAKGASFKGAAAYLLHDKDGASTSTRVAWVETVNLATCNPQMAWRVMAATAMDAARLKEQAGVKKTGPQLQRRRAAYDALVEAGPDRRTQGHGAIRAARDRGAESRGPAGDDRLPLGRKHPHVHVLLNRVSPTDGRMLSSSNEKNALSALALAYEKEGGTVFCKQREVNAELGRCKRHMQSVE